MVGEVGGTVVECNNDGVMRWQSIWFREEGDGGIEGVYGPGGGKELEVLFERGDGQIELKRGVASDPVVVEDDDAPRRWMERVVPRGDPLEGLSKDRVREICRGRKNHKRRIPDSSIIPVYG